MRRSATKRLMVFGRGSAKQSGTFTTAPVHTDSIAAAISGSSTQAPRDVFTKMAPGFIMANAFAPSIFSVSGVWITCRLTASDCFSTVSRSVRSAPTSLKASSST